MDRCPPPTRGLSCLTSESGMCRGVFEKGEGDSIWGEKRSRRKDRGRSGSRLKSVRRVESGSRSGSGCAQSSAERRSGEAEGGGRSEANRAGCGRYIRVQARPSRSPSSRILRRSRSPIEGHWCSSVREKGAFTFPIQVSAQERSLHKRLEGLEEERESPSLRRVGSTNVRLFEDCRVHRT